MAAVTGNVERDDLSEEGSLERGPAFAGLSGIRSEAREMGNTHVSLTRTHLVRSAAEWFLAQCTFRHEWDGSSLILRITKSPRMDGKRAVFPQDAVPFARGGADVHTVKVWSEDNSKMDCPSFDIPAGGTDVGGTCPGANAGQTVVEPATRARAIQRLEALEVPSEGYGAKLPMLKVQPAKTICQSCVTGDTLIMVRGEGLRRIDEMLGRPFEVWSGIDWRTTRVVEQGLKPTLTVRTHHGVELRATADHRILTVDGWVEAGHLESGETLPFALPEPSPFPAQAVSDTKMVVESVEPTGKVEMVYDLLNVGPEQQFVANGLVIHNCYAEGGTFAYADQTARMTLRYWWVINMVTKHFDEFVDVFTRSILKLKFPAGAPGGILPIRLHSSGDFFSIPYARAWLSIANKLTEEGGELGRRVRIWAPTRTWAAPGWPEFWREELPRLKAPNLIVRASGYHFDDPAPGKLSPENAMGSTSMHVTTSKEEMMRRTDFRAQGNEKRFFDWMCPTYAQVEAKGKTIVDARTKAWQVGLKSCTSSPNPFGGRHCRACWVAPDMRINYPAH
jgi:hypothetical protein